MSPLGLLALAFAVVTFGGSAVVFLHDLLEERLARRGVAGGGRSALRPHRLRIVRRKPMPPSGLVVTVKAGARPASRGEVTLRARH